MEDLEEDESDIEDTAEWGQSYWGAPGPAGSQQGARGGDSDSDEDEDDGESYSDLFAVTDSSRTILVNTSVDVLFALGLVCFCSSSNFRCTRRSTIFAVLPIDMMSNATVGDIIHGTSPHGP